MSRFRTTIMISALAFGCQLANATSPEDDVPSVVVHFADLDLTTIDGVAVLYRRLKGAAETVCAAQDGPRFRTCWRAALSRAVTKVDQPALTAYHRAQFNGRNAYVTAAERAGYKVVSLGNRAVFCPTASVPGSRVVLCLPETEFESLPGAPRRMSSESR